MAEAGVTHAHAEYYPPHSPYDPAPDSEPLQAKVDRLRRFAEDVIAKMRP
jgi:hypothetical protein